MLPTFSQSYRPLYFLSALGMGGLAVSFFMYLMFLTKHPKTPLPTFDSVSAAWSGGSLSLRVMIAVVVALIAWFSVRHVQLLVANLRALREFRASAAYESFASSNAEVQLMAVPLTLAMTVNVAFIIAVLAIPGLWGVIEWLFPLALIAFAAVGAYAFLTFGRYVGRLLAHKGFDIEDTNHFSQVLPSFTFVMVAVGFASPAAMSHVPAVSVTAMVLSFLFLAAAAAWIVVKLPVSFAAILRQGLAVEAGPTLWLGIPIFTLVGITFIRLASGVSHTFFDSELSPVVAFVVLGLLLAAQVAMGLMGWAVMRRQGYFTTYVSGEKGSIASYGLICPGVALAVLSMFFIHWGLVRTEIVALFSPGHLALVALVALLQLRTIETIVRLNRKLLGQRAADHVAEIPVGV